MEEQDKKVTQYLVPANVSTRFEFFEGFGWYELKFVVIACLIGVILFYFLGLFKKTTYIHIDDLPFEVTIGVDEEELKPNEDGYIVNTISLIPSPFRVFAIIIPGTVAFFFVKRDPSNGMSLMYTLKSAKEFNNKQKLYLYKYRSGSEV